MYLKRIFDKDAPKGSKLDHIKVLRAGDRQNFSTGMVELAVAEGWMALGGGKITLDTRPPLGYRIVRAPGYYCCHCAVRLGDAAAARAHIEADHPGTISPDPFNRAGYERIHYYDCVKEKQNG